MTERGELNDALADMAKLVHRSEQRDTVGDWKRANPEHCAECFCRPGRDDSNEGTDHESFCSQNEG